MLNSIKASDAFFEIQKKQKIKIIFIFLILFLFYLCGFFIFWLSIKYALTIFILEEVKILTLSYKEILYILIIAVSSAVFHWIFSVSSGLNRILQLLKAQKPDLSDRYHNTFKNIVEEMQVASGCKKVNGVVIPILAINAFSMMDLKGQSIIGVTEGMLARLNRTQLQGVVAHEMAHIVNYDSLIATITCSLFGVFSQILTVIRNLGEGNYRFYIFYPIILITTMGMYILNVTISRQKEYLADATAVKLTRNPLALAEALYKITTHWRGSGYVSKELAPLFIVNPCKSRLDEAEGIISNLFSTHPPIRKRIRILLNMAKTGLSIIDENLRKEKITKERMKQEIAEKEAQIEQTLLTNSRLFFEPQNIISGGCPSCGHKLKEMDYEGVTIRQCLYCKGKLIEEKTIPRILARTEKGFCSQTIKNALEWQEQNKFRPKLNVIPDLPLIRCPDCGRTMLRRFYNYQYFIEVDRCLTCQLIWFDKEELELLQILVEAKTHSK